MSATIEAPRFPVGVAGSGHAVPCNIVHSEEFDRRQGLDAGFLEQATGVRSRYVCAGEDQIDMAVAAAQAAIADAGIGPEEIDLVLGACGVPYQPLPATAPLVMQRLGMHDGAAAAFDVNATCLSFLSAVELAAGRIVLGQSETALVVSSEVASRALPWDNAPEIAALFGDGAAAVILRRSETGRAGIRASLMQSYPSAYDACEIGAGGTRIDYHQTPEVFAQNAMFRMDGKALFKVTHRHFPDFVARLLARASWQAEDVDLVVPHQASPLALQHMVERTGLSHDRVVNIAATHGNQIAASIPTALDIARRDGRIARGARVLMLGTSAGVSFGGMALEV